jgi:formate dehydrogenase alpha subunit
MTNSIEDVCEQAEVILLVGSNPEEAHPVMGMRLRQAVERGAKLIVVDPRTIDLAKQADIHLKLKPGTNVAFANGMVNVLINEGLVDADYVRNRTEGFEELKAMVADYTPERVAEICDIDARDLVAAAKMYANADKAPIIYCLGVVEHSTGTEGVMSLSNLALVAGKLGKPGCGINPLRGQNNVQGACDMGAGPADYTGYQKVANDEVRAKFERAWGVPLPTTPGIKATECFPAMIEGRIKGLFLFGEDPVRTDPDTYHVIHALESLEFLVVEELFMTETAKYADVILPGRSYAEKEGTFTNTERRVQRVRKAVEGPAGPRLDTDVFADIMRRMGYNQPPLTGAQIMAEVASLTPSYGGISHSRLDSWRNHGRGLQWPCPTSDHPGTRIMHVEEFSRGKAAYSLAKYRPSAELPDAEYPLIMMTGRVLAHYNAQAMTGRTEGLNQIDGTSFIEVNTQDAAAAGIADGDRVAVTSRRGRIESTARVSGKTNPGQVWMPFHFQDGNANWLTNAALDNISSTPEYKVCAVRVEKA